MGKEGGGQDEEGERGGLESRDHREGGDQKGAVLASVNTGRSGRFVNYESDFLWGP